MHNPAIERSILQNPVNAFNSPIKRINIMVILFGAINIALVLAAFWLVNTIDITHTKSLPTARLTSSSSSQKTESTVNSSPNSVSTDQSESINLQPKTTDNTVGNNDSASSVQVTQTSTNDGTPKTNVSVNGQPIPVPIDGTKDQTINSPTSHTEINISSNSSTVGSSNNTNTTSTHLNVSSSSNTLSETGGN